MLYVFDGVWPVQVGPLLHSSALLNPAHGDVRHLPSLLTISCNFVSLLMVSSAHTKTKKNENCKFVLSSADLSSAQACSRAENKQKHRALGGGGVGVDLGRHLGGVGGDLGRRLGGGGVGDWGRRLGGGGVGDWGRRLGGGGVGDWGRRLGGGGVGDWGRRLGGGGVGVT